MASQEQRATAMTDLGVKHQLHQRGALDVLGLYVLNARDVEEVVLEVVAEKALHLLRIHSTVRLRDVDRRRAQIGEDIDVQAVHGEPGTESDGDDGSRGETPASSARRPGCSWTLHAQCP